MTDLPACDVRDPDSPFRAVRRRAAAWARAVLEGVVLSLVCLAPWAFGALSLEGIELLVVGGVTVVLALWAARMLLDGCLSWQKSPLALCLAGLFLLGVWQVTPLPRAVLARVSPGTAELYDRLLPETPEVLADGRGDDRAAAAGRTISLYPAATRKYLGRLLAVFLLFAAVRNNTASAAGLRRLSVAALVNGAALSLFALAQFLSSAPNVVYWTYTTAGHVFGPFVNRNHFAFFLNPCIGLGLGLLLGRFAQLAGPAGGRGRGEVAPPPGVLRDPTMLWILAGLALMTAAVLCSLSRGGFLALVGATVVCLLMKRPSVARWRAVGTVAALAVLALLLASWVGFDRISQRLATLGGEKGLATRLPIWRRMAPLAADFPVWGTGLGTYVYVEVLPRHRPGEMEALDEYAHNEYLELLLEGGVPALLLGLLVVGLVFRQGRRAIGRGGETAALAWGGLFGFTAITIHNVVEFGLHIAPITLLATVLAAQLDALGRGRRVAEPAGAEPPPDEYRVRLGGLGPVLGAVLVAVLGLRAYGAAALSHRLYRLQDEASRLTAPERLPARVEILSAAARLAPEDVTVLGKLGATRLKYAEGQTARRKRDDELARAAGAVAAARGDWAAVLAWSAADAAGHEAARAEQERLAREYLVPGLHNLVRARNCCPILNEPNLALATHPSLVRRGDPPQAYLDRVKQISGASPAAWYQAGACELEAGRTEQAWASWRRCLEMSDRYLPEILEASSRALGPQELAEKVMPDRPSVLMAAARRLYPDAGEADDRRPFYQKAVRGSEGPAEDLTPDDLHARARAYRELGQPDEAASAYRRLLATQPDNADWHCELAELFQDQGRLEEARRELVVVVARRPDHGRARELLALVTYELARKKARPGARDP